jgi:prophage regulatory protein
MHKSTTNPPAPQERDDQVGGSLQQHKKELASLADQLSRQFLRLLTDVIDRAEQLAQAHIAEAHELAARIADEATRGAARTEARRRTLSTNASGQSAGRMDQKLEQAMQTPLPQRPLPDLLSVKEVSRLLGVSARCLWRWVAEGLFPSPMHLSRRVTRWRREDLLGWLATRDQQQKGGRQ